MVTTQNPPDTSASSNGTSLLGSTPKAFNGNRDDAKEFMCSYIRWWKLNDKKPAFHIPYKQVALCLSYTCGRKVKDQADEQQEAIDWKLTHRYAWKDEELWEEFAKTFKDTFMDIAKSVKVENKIQTLCIQDGNINIYITTFKKLLKATRYTENEHSALKMFKTGLLSPPSPIAP